ncbi:MAG: alpha/beta hydrolase [Pseudomonadota bacterium]
MSLIAARDVFSARHPEVPVEVSGRRWGKIRAGVAGPALVLLPGTLGRADIFWQQIEGLAGQARILSLSYPAEGGIADWVADIVHLAEEEDLGPATILGSSLGGYLAQYTSARHPDRFPRLVAANTLVTTEMLGTMPPYSLDLENLAIETLARGFTDGLAAMKEAAPAYADLVDLLLAEVAGRIPGPELRRRLIALKEAPGLPPPGPAAATTIESGDDHLIPEPVRADVRARLAPARAFRFDWGSHFPYVTRPALYTALLEEVLGLSDSAQGWTDGPNPAPA